MVLTLLDFSQREVLKWDLFRVQVAMVRQQSPLYHILSHGTYRVMHVTHADTLVNIVSVAQIRIGPQNIILIQDAKGEALCGVKYSLVAIVFQMIL